MTGTSAWLLVVEDPLGNVSDQREVRDGILIAGRSRQCDLVLPSESVSRKHARFFVQGGRLVVEDLGSSNGLWLGDRRIQQATALQDGDLLRLGEFRIRIRCPAATEAEEVRIRLVGMSPGVLDQVVEMRSEVLLVGRGRDCGLVLLDPSVSRNHARLLGRPDGSVIVEDLESANGVFVDDSRVRVRELAQGDRLRFGDVEFLVEMPLAGTVRSPRRCRGRRLALGTVAVLVAGVGVGWWLARPSQRMVPVQASGPIGEREIVPASPVPPPDVTGEAPERPDGSSGAKTTDPGILDEARRLLSARRVEEARLLVQRFLADHPLNVDAVRLANRLELEHLASEALAASDRDQAAGRIEAALQGLFSIPGDSVFADDVRARLRALRSAMDRERARACRAGLRSVACIRWKALQQKAEAYPP